MQADEANEQLTLGKQIWLRGIPGQLEIIFFAISFEMAQQESANERSCAGN